MPAAMNATAIPHSTAEKAATAMSGRPVRLSPTGRKDEANAPRLRSECTSRNVTGLPD